MVLLVVLLVVQVQGLHLTTTTQHQTQLTQITHPLLLLEEEGEEEGEEVVVEGEVGEVRLTY